MLLASGPGRAQEPRPKGLQGREVGHVRPPLPSKAAIAKLPPDGGPLFNRLIFESSPYLLQHARNPVDWYPWGDAAFERAKKEGKPVFLSIGYSTCHWCHVMERESFENEEVANLLNEHFVCIKVDREERPDVDAVYMAALQAMIGGGGWPMSMFLTPDRKPFWGGTYFPPEDSFGRPGVKTVLQSMAAHWEKRRDDIVEGAERLTALLKTTSGGDGAEIGAGTLRKAYEAFATSFDETYGGFGEAPKFPRSHTLSFLLRYHARTGERKALDMVEGTLDHIVRGGIHDHLGGGFHRYATDRTWLVPHFEKMLYDQALLARTCLEALQVTGNTRYAGVARDIFDYVLRDMTDPAGGFYCAEDADSEGVEGRFYVWAKDELAEVLGEKDGLLFASVYGVRERGNDHEEVSGEATGSNILHLETPLPVVARELETDLPALEARLAAMRKKLLTVRERRIHPHKDDKVLADWNGLMIGALAFGGRVLGEPVYLEAARRAAGFVIGTMEKDGRLLHCHRGGAASVPAYLDDYAFVSLGLLDLYEATFEIRWLRESMRLAGEMIRLFWDDEKGGFHLSASDGEPLIARTKDLYDGALPSGNSVATLVLLKLGRLTRDEHLEEVARKNLDHFSGWIDQVPSSCPFMLMALEFAAGPTKEVVLAGPVDDAGLRALYTAINGRFLPGLVLTHHPSGEAAADIEVLVPFLKGLVPVDGKPAAYVCENHACHLPVTHPEEMLALIEGDR